MTLPRQGARPGRAANADWRRQWPQAVALAGTVALSCFASVASEEPNLVKAGTLNIEQVQVAWIGSGNVGGGKLDFRGKLYNFSIGGLGVGGFGISKVTASGTVYNMTDIAQFPGAYAQGRYGFAAADTSKGELWLKNGHGVVMHLAAKRVGLALSLGGDAIYIKMD
jgi:hypothetical protein